MCGLAGIISMKNRKETELHPDITGLKNMALATRSSDLASCKEKDISLQEHYLGGKELLDNFLQAARSLKKDGIFAQVFTNRNIQDEIAELAENLSDIIDREAALLEDRMGYLQSREVDVISGHIEVLRDIAWCLGREIGDNIGKIRYLISQADASPASIKIFKNINVVLNSIDRLEMRGRDSAGISLIFILDADEFEKFEHGLDKAGLSEQLRERSGNAVLMNRHISIGRSGNSSDAGISFAYKIAAEIGSLGDNVVFLREQIANDPILHMLVNFSHAYHTVISHTRWASVGAISEPNCHPADNKVGDSEFGTRDSENVIHVCLNGDIDNYLKLKQEYELAGKQIPEDIGTDTKIIPLQIEKYVEQGKDVGEAFRLAVNCFEGSHAISMHTDLAPGKVFLAQRGSGQAIFVGLAEDHHIPASEVYGFVEETPFYLKVDGEKTVQGKQGPTQGQIFVLDQNSRSGLSGITAMFYDGTPLELGDEDVKYTEITSRDIDRQQFSHYFLKEISESPDSVEKTISNRWKIRETEGKQHYVTALDETVFPRSLEDALVKNEICRIFFVGQGTAGVAAQACADILSHYMNDPDIHIRSLKASELSGFRLDEHVDPAAMRDTLVVAISQSGTTTDTNRTVDMVRERGAHTLAIVNRRDSDITFKADGVMYTSSGRDIEMSVASTKAFYSQIVAGALMSLHMTSLRGRRDRNFITSEIRQLQQLPDHMRKILTMREQIEASAKRLAITRTYWAAVGSGPNKTSADEIRIKLSELCYKTISSDYVEDKKHIDLSSEPLIIVCAAGTRKTVISDIIKDTAIFHAHKALPVIIADEGEERFAPYARDVFHVPVVSEHFAPVVNTLVGHIWGYYAALAINGGSSFLYDFREEIQATIEKYAEQGMDVYELVLEKSFREKIARFYREFRKRKAEERIPVIMSFDISSDITLLLKYLSGRLPVADFEMDFRVKGTARNMLDKLFECLGTSINNMSRPVDAIKHQAKTVTVGTSRISDKTEGILFETLTDMGFRASQLTAANVLVLRNLQGVVSDVKGITLYKISGLSFLGEATDETVIEVVKRKGSSASLPSRVDMDRILKGSKKIIVREGNVYIGKGRKDGRSILVIPIISASSSMQSMIEHLLLLNISFKEAIPLSVKIKALGGKYERIKNNVQENSISWKDSCLELVETQELFGISAEKIGDFIGLKLKD